LLFLTAILCSVFIAKNVFDTAVAEEFSIDVEKNFSEKLIFASRELYTELYQNSPVPYFLIDIDGQVRSANLAAHRLFGLSKGKMEGVNVFSRILSDEQSHLDMVVEKYRNGIPVSDEVVRVRRPNDAEAWALLSLFHFVSVKEQLGLLTLVDISKQKQVENAKSEFVSLASHQLRTPIAGIKWSAELLQMDNPQNLTERQRKYIERLLTAAKRMALLVDDFLRVSRFELGTFQPEYVKVNLTDLINDIVLEHAGRIEQKHLDIKTFFDSDIASIVSDQNLLRMVITNLFSNAVKYTREGGTIHIGFGRKNDNLLISVADNGMGIPAEDQERVFGKLFRASNAVRQVPDGTGLGLYIVKEAIKVLGGSINFTSIENINTTFEITLPLQLPKST
jgi:PAS domain S-box-containing protein